MPKATNIPITSRRKPSGAPLLLAPPAAGTEACGCLDVDLLAACARLQALDAESRRSIKLTDVLVATPESEEAELVRLRVSEERDKVMQAIADAPAHTKEGLRAKAQAIIAFHGGRRNYGDRRVHKRLEWSLFLDAAGGLAV